MKTILNMLAAACAMSALAARAQDDDFDFGDDSLDATEAVEAVDAASGDAADSEEADGEEGEGEGEAPQKPAKAQSAKTFTALPFCRSVVGHAEVLKPGANGWAPAEEGKYYPLGSAYRTLDKASSLKVNFGQDVSVEIDRYAASFSTTPQTIGQNTREISLDSGVITLKLPRNMPEGLFKITAPAFTIVNPNGVSRYAYTKTVDGDVAQIRCVTGTLAIEGRHFKFPELKAANEVKIRASQDNLFTGLYGKSGDCLVVLDQGDIIEREFNADGAMENKVTRKTLEWKLTPKTAARIYRALPSIGERMAVTMMTFDASGSLKNRCAFVEGRPEVNTGELGPVADDARNEAAKKAAEAAETEAVDIDVAEGAEEDATSDEAPASEEAAPADTGTDDFEF